MATPTARGRARQPSDCRTTCTSPPSRPAARAGQRDQRARADERTHPWQAPRRDVEAPGEEQSAESDSQSEEQQAPQDRRAWLYTVRISACATGSSRRSRGSDAEGEGPGDEVAVLSDDPVRDVVVRTDGQATSWCPAEHRPVTARTHDETHRAPFGWTDRQGVPRQGYPFAEAQDEL